MTPVELKLLTLDELREACVDDPDNIRSVVYRLVRTYRPAEELLTGRC